MAKKLEDLYTPDSLHEGLLDKFDHYMDHKDDKKAAWRKKVVTKFAYGSPVVDSLP